MEKYSNIEFRFIGNTEIVDEKINDTFKNYFYKKYQKEKWIDKVIFLGQVSNEEKEQEYANCDILIAPSLYESFGIILIEAMSAKKPVIACKIGGMQEIVEDAYNGFLIEAENSKELYDRISILVEDKNLRNDFGDNSFIRFNEMFSNKAMIENTLKAYYKFIKNK